MDRERLSNLVTAYPDDENAMGTDLLYDLTRFVESAPQTEVTAFFESLNHDQCMNLVMALGEVNEVIMALLKTVAVQHHKVCPNRDGHRLDLN